MVRRVALVLGVICAVAPVALADDKTPAPADLKMKGAVELRDLGNKLFEDKNYLGALAVYKEAYERFPNAAHSATAACCASAVSISSG